MTYTINGKEWTELDINERCTELMGWKEIRVSSVSVQVLNHAYHVYEIYDPCNNPADTDAIIDKCWDELMLTKDTHGFGTWTHWDNIKWVRIMSKHNCTKLIAACICFIEIN